jgi:hypothetical protein
VELLEHVVLVRGRTLAEEHPDRLASQLTHAKPLEQISTRSATPKFFFRLSNIVQLLYIGALSILWSIMLYIFG